MKILRYVSVIFMLLLLCLSGLSYGFCPPGGGSPDLNTITGIVKDANEKPIHKVKVRVKDTYMFYFTDENGFFIFTNVDLESPTLTFEQRIKNKDPNKPGSTIKTAELTLGDIGMKKVLFIENIILGDNTAKAKTIHTKDAYDMTGMTEEDLKAFQFSDAPLEEQVKGFLGIREDVPQEEQEEIN